MKLFYPFFVSLLALISCESQKHIISVTNNSNIDRVDEVVELKLENPDDYTIFSNDGVQVVCQTTYDGKLIFAANVEANSTVEYELRRGNRLPIDTIATGDVYPQWFDDYAWENDKIGFRTYSKKMGERGQKLYGFDIFSKRAKTPVLDILYGVNFDKKYQQKLKQLREEKSKSAQQLSAAITYHVDHGIGMDYYVVGPTLGCGTAALVNEGEIQYPSYYDTCEVLDKGGLRLTFRLTYAPVYIGGDMVTEVRTVSLDSGTHFNRVDVEYKGLTKKSAAVIGIVLHDDGKVSDIGKTYMSYAEPEHEFGWQIYNAVIFPEDMKASIVYFEEAAGAAQGHLLSEGEYTPNSKLSYYMGAGWNRWGFADHTEWFRYVEQQQQMYAEPLLCELK